MRKPANRQIRASVPAVSDQDVVEFVLFRIMYNECYSPLRIDAQDGTGNVLDGGGTQGVNQGPNEDLPARSWHGRVGRVHGKGGEGEGKLECPGLCLFQLVDMWYRNECRAGRVLGTTTTDDTRSYGLI